LATGLAHNFVVPVSRQRELDPVQRNLPNTPFTRNLEKTLDAKGFRLSFILYDEQQKLEKIRELADSPDYCDGLLLSSPVIVDEPVAQLLLDRGVPHVANTTRAEAYGINTVAPHSIGGLRRAIAHLRQFGHHRIGYFGPVADKRRGRYPLFVAAMIEANLELDGGRNCSVPYRVANRSDDHWRERAQNAFSQWLNSTSATALICQYDTLALVALEVMRARGLQLGRDLSIVGYGNAEAHEPYKVDRPILTTINNRSDQVGRRCAELLMNQVLHKQTDIVHELIPVELIVRETTGPNPEAA
jgi:LacI family transcriptional regulator